jgi:hypothetical protein
MKLKTIPNAHIMPRIIFSQRINELFKIWVKNAILGGIFQQNAKDITVPLILLYKNLSLVSIIIIEKDIYLPIFI